MKNMRTILILLAFQTMLGQALAQNGKSEAFSKSYIFESNKNYKAAITALEAIYSDASYPVNLRLGWLHYLDGNYRQSRIYYQKAIQTEPKSVEARLGIVLPLSAEDNWKEVVLVYKKILEIDPGNSLVNYRLALIYYNRKEFEKAVPHIKKVTAMYSFDYDSQLLLAKIEVSRGNIMEAQKALGICLQYSPSSKEALGMWEKLK